MLCVYQKARPLHAESVCDCEHVLPEIAKSDTTENSNAAMRILVNQQDATVHSRKQLQLAGMQLASLGRSSDADNDGLCDLPAQLQRFTARVTGYKCAACISRLTSVCAYSMYEAVPRDDVHALPDCQDPGM